MPKKKTQQEPRHAPDEFNQPIPRESEEEGQKRVSGEADDPENRSHQHESDV